MGIFTHIYYCQDYHTSLELQNIQQHILLHCSQQKILEDIKKCTFLSHFMHILQKDTLPHIYLLSYFHKFC